MNEAQHHLLTTSLDTCLAEHQTICPEGKVLAMFHRCAAEVPAYSHFVEAHGINSAEIKSYPAYQALPLMNKANYMQAYPLPERCFGGDLKGSRLCQNASFTIENPVKYAQSNSCCLGG